jgi:hypothetical protein
MLWPLCWLENPHGGFLRIKSMSTESGQTVQD